VWNVGTPECSKQNLVEPEVEVTNCTQSPITFVIDDEEAICDIVTKAFTKLGIETKKFHTAKAVFAELDSGHPPVILLDVALAESDAIDVIHGLAARRYAGVIHVMSGARTDLVNAVERIGKREGLTFGAPLCKPFRVTDLTAIGNNLLAAAPEPTAVPMAAGRPALQT
jgi:two-component system nitrogen regulation response regulator GlnG